jgi:hypothetical protein
MQVNNLTTTSALQQFIPDNPQENSEYLQLQGQLEKIFFTPLEANYIDNQNAYELKTNKLIENQNFYDRLNLATDNQLIVIFTSLLKKLKVIANFYCSRDYISSFNNIITRIKTETLNKDITLRFKNICTALYKLTTLLQNLQYQHESAPTTAIISKEVIAARLEECLEYLDLCWDGIFSRFTHEYEIFNSIQQGLTGKIFLIRKNLFQIVASQFIQSLKQDKNYNFYDDEEIHIYNLLHNLVALKLGFVHIEDNFIDEEEFPQSFQKEFQELITIKISAATITYRLVEQFYEKLVNCLTTMKLQDWLYQSKTDLELNRNMHLLETEFFAPINILFNKSEAKLNITTIIEQVNDEYSLNKSSEKLHLWITRSLMPPNTEKILLANIDNKQSEFYSIITIGYIFYWVVNHNDYKNDADKIEFNPDSYISLTLNHLKKLDFIDFSGININQHLDLLQHDTKIAISLSLISQALYQTHSAIEIMLFLTDANINNILQDAILIDKTIKTILKNKLDDNTYKKHFINEIIKYYTDPLIDRLTKNEIDFFIKYELFVEIFREIIDCNFKIVENFFDFINHDKPEIIVQQFAILPIATIHKVLDLTNSNRNLLDNLFILFVNIKNDYLIYEILTHCNPSLDSTQYNDCLRTAIYNNNNKLIDLLLNKKDKKINSYVLSAVLCCDNYLTYNKIIRYITNNIKNYNKNELLQLLQARDTSGNSVIFTAISSKKNKRLKRYIDFILSLKELNQQEKIFIIKEMNKNAALLQFIISYIANLYAIERYIKEYINFIIQLDIPRDEVLKIIESKNINGDSILYLAIKNEKTVVTESYVSNILKNTFFSIEEKFTIILAQGSAGNGLSLAIQSKNVNVIYSYLKKIIEKELFSSEQLFKILQAIDIKGNSGFSIIFKDIIETNIRKNHVAYTGIFIYYCKTIMKNKQLTNQQQVELLLAKNSDNTTGLLLALQKNVEGIAINYINNILNSLFLTADNKLEIILTQGNNSDIISIAAVENKIFNILKKILSAISIRSTIAHYGRVQAEGDKIYNDCIYIINTLMSRILNNNKFSRNNIKAVCEIVRHNCNLKTLINQSNLPTDSKGLFSLFFQL